MEAALLTPFGYNRVICTYMQKTCHACTHATGTQQTTYNIADIFVWLVSVNFRGSRIAFQQYEDTHSMWQKENTSLRNKRANLIGHPKL